MFVPAKCDKGALHKPALRESMAALVSFCFGHWNEILHVPCDLRGSRFSAFRFGPAFTDDIDTNHI